MAVRDNRNPRITGREALKVHALIDAMTISARAGAVVKVSPMAAGD